VPHISVSRVGAAVALASILLSSGTAVTGEATPSTALAQNNPGGAILTPLTPDRSLPTFKPVEDGPAVTQPGETTPADKGRSLDHWPAVYDSPIYYYSTDLSPITLTLRNFNEPDLGRRALLRIPRAYVVFVRHYEPKDLNRLPDVVDTEAVKVALTFPDGKPLSVHGLELGTTNGRGMWQALHELRSQQYDADLSYVPPEIPWEERTRTLFGPLRGADTLDGLEHFRSRGIDVYFGRQGIDEFIYIRCSPFEQAHPIYFCTTGVRLARDLVARIMFLDFRFHGGRSFANERVRAFREAVCRFIVPACSETATARPARP
jgi:hypothetical protein